jgi:cobalt-zinc-cadmium resistance protein CzcA
MLSKIIDFAVDKRWTVLAAAAAFAAGGIYIALNIPVDAFPDLTNNQVLVTTECPAMPPAEVDRLVTFPLESALMGLPSTQTVRSTSKLGLSMITVVFDDNVNTYFARQLVNERIQQAISRLPAGLQPELGPVATAFGEVYQYTVDGPQSLMERKQFHDWQLRLQLRTLPGISEVNSWGGETRQFQIETTPDSLQRYSLTLHDIEARVVENNANFGGGFLTTGPEQLTMRGLGRAKDAQDLGGIVLLARGGTPVYLRDVAQVKVGPMPRQGAVLHDGKGETVTGMVIQRKGENGLRTIEAVKEAIAQFPLPAGMRIRPFYDQSEVIYGTIHTVRKNLLEAGVLVVAVLLLFLGNMRAALIVALVIPLSMLFGFAGMALFGISANLMSLGAVDFGMIVDGAVVLMENSVRRVSEDRGAHPLRSIREAGHEVARPVLFGVAIIIAVYMPIFFLEDLEGRMFRPMAVTVCSALLGSLILSLTLVPALGAFALRNAREKHSMWFERVKTSYSKSLGFVLHHRIPFVSAAVVLVVGGLISVRYIGTEFMPKLDEGSLLVTTRKLPGISLPESIGLSRKVEQMLLTFPEVTSVTTKLGRPDLATEAMGVYESDSYVGLKPREEWTTAHDREALVAAIAKKLETLPGVVYNFTQPMAMRVDEVVTGIKADVAIKIFGEDPDELEKLANRAQKVLAETPGSADVQAEVISGIGELHVDVDRPALARYGLNVSDVSQLVDSASGGVPVSELIENERRYPIVMRLPDNLRSDPAQIEHLALRSPMGELVKLDQVARISTNNGPEIVSREKARRRIVVQSNVRGTDLGGFVTQAKERMAKELAIPPGYSMTWGGQFENQERASKRLMIVLPVSLAIIFVLLYTTFRSAGESLLILGAVPFALVGGIGALWLRGLNLNVAASIGFIALFGVAVLNGIVMVSYIDQLRSQGSPMALAVRRGAAMRLRPVLMTALVASLGFVPMAFSQSQGAEVQRPLATVVIGGLVTSTILTLYLIPAAYPWFSRRHYSPIDETIPPAPPFVHQSQDDSPEEEFHNVS